MAEAEPRQVTVPPPAAGHRRAAVLGSPIAHSLSPVLHRAAYAALGLDGWRYDAVEVVEDELAGFVRGLDPSWAGLSLTMPLKRAVLPLLAGRSDLAAAVGAVNTVTFPDGVPQGDNTDVHGIVAALAAAGVDRAHGVGPVAVLGGGATAASAIAALRELGCSEPVVHVRDPTRARDLFEAADRLGVRPRTAPLDATAVAGSLGPPDGAPGAPVLVSTLPAGAADALAAALARVPAPGAPATPVLLDVVYAPWPTVLGTAASAAGWRVVGGLEMLLHQAGEQVRLMTGLAAPLDEMRAAAAARLRRAVEQPSSRTPEVPTPSA